MSKWARMADQAPEAHKKTAGGSLAPEPAQHATAENEAPCDYGQITVQLFRNLYDTGGHETLTGAVRDVLNQLGEMHPLPIKPNDAPKYGKTKAQAPLFNMAIYDANTPEGANRAEGTWQRGYWGVVGDADALSAEEIAAFDARLDRLGWLHLKATSFKHTKEAPRVRYVVPVAAPMSAEEYPRAWSALNALAGGKLDQKASDPTRRSYSPSCPQGEEVTRPPAVISGLRRVSYGELVSHAPQGNSAASAPAAGSTKYDPSINADVLPQHDDTPADFELIRRECEAVRWAADPANQPHVDETLWRSMLGIVKHCAGANELAHDVSKHHPEYDRDLTDKKLAGWTAGPTTCAEFSNHSPACAGCRHKGKIKSPIVLGRAHQRTKQEAPAGGLAVAIGSGALRSIVDQDGALNYVETYVKDGRTCVQVVRAGSGAANDLILTMAAASGGKPPSKQAIDMGEAQLRTKAKRAGEVTPVAIRVAQEGDTRYVDHGPGRIARIDPQGWALVDESEGTPLFRRGAGAGELPDPTPFNGDARAAFAHCVRHYQEVFNTPIDQAVVRIAVAVDRLDPDTAHPICEYVGPAGSGKSTAAEHDVGMIDPPSKEGLRTCGFKVEDIAAAAQQQFVLTMDNVSRFDKTTADTLCMASTGGTLTARKMYEQTETVAMHILRPVVVTAVNPVCTQPDLQTRTLRFEFRANPSGEMLSEGEIRAQTADRLSALLGALYTLKAETLRNLPEVRKRKGFKHRQITFDQTGEAMLCAAGYPPGSFLKIIGTLRESMARRSASGDVFLLKVCAALQGVQSWPKDDAEPTIRQIMARPRAASVFETDTGMGALMRPGVLLGLLPRPDPWDRNPPIPKTERALMDALRRVQPTLHGMGVLYREQTHGSRPVLRFDWRAADLNDIEATA